jgi:hypothetical protein
MKGRIALIIIAVFIITSCDFLFSGFKEDEKDYSPIPQNPQTPQYPQYPQNPLISAVSITPSEPFVGDTLTASFAGGDRYWWERSDTENFEEWIGIGENRSSYTLCLEDNDKYIRVNVSYVYNYNPVNLTSKAVYVGVHSLAGSVRIIGNAVEEATLIADTDDLQGTGDISYRWERAVTADAADWITIGEDEYRYYGASYPVQQEDVGKYIRLTVTSSHNIGSITSEPTAAVAFYIVGTAFVDDKLYRYNENGNVGCQWERADTADGVWIAVDSEWITIENYATWYTLDEVDLGKYIRLTITRDDNTSIHSRVVGPVLLPRLTGTVSINGSAAIGEQLAADTGSLGGNGTISYQWKRWDGVSYIPETIGDDSPVYTVAAEDKGKQIQVTVTRSRNSGSITSTRTDPVATAKLGGTVSIDGVFNVDDTLTANTSNLKGSGEISYQWHQRTYSSILGGYSYTNIGSNSPTYTLTDGDVGKWVGVNVTCADNSGSMYSEFKTITNNLSGTVSITGEPAMGETLTADTSLLKGKGTITYEWRARGSNGTSTAVGRNSSSYTINSEDIGKTIYVTVSRSDRNNSVTSPSTAQVYKAPLTGTLSISGTAAVGEQLSVAGSLGGSGAATYQWQSGYTPDADGLWTNIAGYYSYSYTPDLAQEGKYIRVTVTRANNEGSVSSEAAGPIIILPLDGTVSINGTAAVEQTLTANILALKGSGTVSYQWERAVTANGPWGSVGTDNSQYQIVEEDYGKYIRLTVSRANNEGTVSSAATSSAVGIPVLSGTVSIGGEARQDETLYAITGSLLGTGNPWGSGDITYLWESASSTSGLWYFAGNGTSYALTAADVGKYIRLTVRRDGYSGSVSNTTPAIALPLLTGTISISGTRKVGEILTAETGSLGGSGAITYQWHRGDSAGGSAWTSVGTDLAQYTPVALDYQKYIRLTVTRAGNSGSVAASVYIASIDPIPGTVTLSTTNARVGESLTAVITGNNNTSGRSYQWQRGDTTNASTWTTVGTSASYYPVKADVGKYIRVTVSSNYYSGTLISNVTSAVILAPLTGKVTITKPSINSPTLRANTTELGGSGAITYKWERCVTATLGVLGAWEDLHASGYTYTYTPLQLFSYYRVTVTRENNSGQVVSDWYLVTIL